MAVTSEGGCHFSYVACALPQRRARILCAGLKGGGDVGEEVEAGACFDGGNGGTELGVVVVDAGMGFVGVKVRYALGCGNGAS